MYPTGDSPAQVEAPGNALVTIEEVGERLGGSAPPSPPHALAFDDERLCDTVPVNLKTEDKFHITLEEYLHAIISLVEELVRKKPTICHGRLLTDSNQARLMTNAVTQRDFKRPQLISTFVKDIHASFQVLNLKNDSLRRRSDGLKYNVKKVEDICYDLIVRNLIATEPAPPAEDGEMVP